MVSSVSEGLGKGGTSTAFELIVKTRWRPRDTNPFASRLPGTYDSRFIHANLDNLGSGPIASVRT